MTDPFEDVRAALAAAHDALVQRVAELEATNQRNLGLLEVIEQIGVERDALREQLQALVRQVAVKNTLIESAHELIEQMVNWGTTQEAKEAAAWLKKARA